MVKFYINDIYYEEKRIEERKTIFQKCSEKKIDLPCFCYHENLSIAGNCRMCLIEIDKSQKLVISCATSMQQNIKIKTKNKRINKARESILEFLLVNHPLDCPICDQGGECDLQDITLIFGSDKSRFYEYNKRSVYEKECGPLIKMIMTRCIHCTRCIRFLEEISNNYKFGMVNRGNNSEITTFTKKLLNEELSGNIIDLCPVGALTSKPFAFTARAWELNDLESIDILDSMLSSIRIDYINNKIYRILPIYDKYINEDWITNKIRFCYDSQNIQRLYYPIIKKYKNIYLNLNWIDSFFLFYFWLKIYLISSINRFVYFLIGDYNGIYTILNIQNFLNLIGIDIQFFNQFYLNYDYKINYIMPNIKEINNLILIGINLRLELPILNSKLRKRFNNKLINIYNFYNDNFFTVGCIMNNNLLNIISTLYFKNICNKKLLFKKVNLAIYNYKKKNKNLNIFFGLKYLYQNKNQLNEYIYNYLSKFFHNTEIVTIISNSSYLNFFEIGINYKFSNIHNFKNSFIFLNNVDNITDIEQIINNDTNFLIYQGSYFDNGAIKSDLILPTNNFFENSEIYINIEARLRKLNKIVNFLKIIYNPNDLFKYLKLYYKMSIYKFLNYNSLENIIKYFKFIKLNWRLSYKNFKQIYILKNIKYNYNYKKFFYNNYIINLIYNYYKSDNFLKYSKNLHLVSTEYSTNIFLLN